MFPTSQEVINKVHRVCVLHQKLDASYETFCQYCLCFRLTKSCLCVFCLVYCHLWLHYHEKENFLQESPESSHVNMGMNNDAIQREPLWLAVWSLSFSNMEAEMLPRSANTPMSPKSFNHPSLWCLYSYFLLSMSFSIYLTHDMCCPLKTYINLLWR